VFRIDSKQVVRLISKFRAAYMFSKLKMKKKVVGLNEQSPCKTQWNIVYGIRR